MSLLNIAAILAFWLAVALDALRDSAQDAALVSGQDAVQWPWTFEWWHTVIKPGEHIAWFGAGLCAISTDMMWLAYPGAIMIGSALWQVLYSYNRYGEAFAVTRMFVPGCKGDRAREWSSTDWQRAFAGCSFIGMVLIAIQVLVS